ncbi:MAG: hypothetical protein U0746_19440 [Gemmataceae bacterium]
MQTRTRGPRDWAKLAALCAERGYQERRTCPRGLILVKDDNTLAFFDNSPPCGSMVVREVIAELFQAHLADAGVRVLATATHPRSGPDDGLTLALLLDANVSQESAVTAAWNRTATATDW